MKRAALTTLCQACGTLSRTNINLRLRYCTKRGILFPFFIQCELCSQILFGSSEPKHILPQEKPAEEITEPEKPVDESADQEVTDEGGTQEGRLTFLTLGAGGYRGDHNKA